MRVHSYIILISKVMILLFLIKQVAGVSLSNEKDSHHLDIDGAFIPEYILDCLRDGDLILEAGNTILSYTIIKLLNEPRPFSHIGMLVYREDSWQVLHTLSGDVSKTDGLRFEPLTDFLSDAHPANLMIVRPIGGNPDSLVAAAIELLSVNKPFDRYFDLIDSSELYCAEFIYHALRRAGYPAWTPDTLYNGQIYLGFRHWYKGGNGTVIYDARNK